MGDIRYIGTCTKGHHAAGTAADFPTARDHYANTLLVRCEDKSSDPRGCSYALRLWPVKATAGKRECGAWCTDGSGRKCTCICEGRNHGSTYSHTGALWYAR